MRITCNSSAPEIVATCKRLMMVLLKKWSAIGIQSERVILVNKQNFAPVIPVVKKSINADIIAPSALISPSNRLRTGVAICQIPKRADEKMTALINEYLVSDSLMNRPRKILSSIATLMIFPTMQKMKNNIPVCLP